MTNYVKIRDCLYDGVKVGEIGIYREDFEKVREAVFLDPKKNGYNHTLVAALLENDFISKAEHDILQMKVATV